MQLVCQYNEKGQSVLVPPRHAKIHGEVTVPRGLVRHGELFTTQDLLATQ
ncbi:hypothetical protein E2C01_082404 [Portunus trituberculatus]|uniref:Uncharacterized protein n=1 Tax=Portunus trituberculatus TaxID=210409 RepID=A0A5B7IZ11_PORTR|nr:hypothetical protein [Portunus trituberculatus]